MGEKMKKLTIETVKELAKCDEVIMVNKYEPHNQIIFKNCYLYFTQRGLLIEEENGDFQVFEIDYFYKYKPSKEAGQHTVETIIRSNLVTLKNNEQQVKHSLGE
tara:strand:- start:984 stop:1295 length:312 start_codon:yes stop_codon:yes gene_type:complete